MQVSRALERCVGEANGEAGAKERASRDRLQISVLHVVIMATTAQRGKDDPCKSDRVRASCRSSLCRVVCVLMKGL